MTSTGAGWRPKVVALDLDGTVVQWIDGVGQASKHISPTVLRTTPVP